MDCIQSTAAAVKESSFVLEVAYVWDNSLQLTNELLKLSCFAQRRTYLLKQAYTVIEGFAEPMLAPAKMRFTLSYPDSIGVTLKGL